MSSSSPTKMANKQVSPLDRIKALKKTLTKQSLVEKFKFGGQYRLTFPQEKLAIMNMGRPRDFKKGFPTKAMVGRYLDCLIALTNEWKMAHTGQDPPTGEQLDVLESAGIDFNRDHPPCRQDAYELIQDNQTGTIKVMTIHKFMMTFNVSALDVMDLSEEQAEQMYDVMVAEAQADKGEGSGDAGVDPVTPQAKGGKGKGK